MNTPPRAFNLRPALIAGALIGVGLLLILIWPVARSVVEALTDYSELIAHIALAFVIVLLLSVARAALAYGRRLELEADQAGLTKLPDGQPIHVADVRSLLERGIVEQSLKRYYRTTLAEAQRPFPHLASYHPVIRIDGTSEVVTAEEPALLIEPPAFPPLTPGLTRLEQLQGLGHIGRSNHHLLVSYDAQHQPLSIDLRECGFIGIGGQPRVGKSTTTTLLIAQAVLQGWHVFVGDPHLHKADGLLNRCRPLSGMLARQAVTPDEIVALIRLVDKIGRKRVLGDANRTPVLLVLDEFTNLVWRELLPDDVLALLPSMAIEYAGVGVHGCIISHDWSKASLGGDLGAALRRSITHRIVHRMDEGNAEFLLPRPTAALARQIATLEKGQCVYWGGEGATIGRVPWIDEADLRFAAQGAPERPYQPWPAERLRPLAPPTPALVPTTPIPTLQPRPAPPTERLPPPTVQEQIVELLTLRRDRMTSSQIAAALGLDLKATQSVLSNLQWMTSTEIAAALGLDLKIIQNALTDLQWMTSSEIAAALGLDLKVTQNALADLHRLRMVDRRKPTRNVPEKFEYATHPPTHPSPSITISA